MKYMMVNTKDKETKNLYDLYKHYNDKVIMKLEYIPTGINDAYRFFINAELREVSFEDASICVSDDEDRPVFFDLLYILDNDRKIYEHFLFETFDYTMKESSCKGMKDELMLKKAIVQRKTFYGMINPTFFLTLLNDDECIQILLDQGFVGLNLIGFKIEVTIISV